MSGHVYRLSSCGESASPGLDEVAANNGTVGSQQLQNLILVGDPTFLTVVLS